MTIQDYLIDYMVTRTMEPYGEFSGNQIVEKHSMISVSNDLNEIFTDLFEKHRYDSLLGIEILGVHALRKDLEEDVNSEKMQYLIHELLAQ